MEFIGINQNLNFLASLFNHDINLLYLSIKPKKINQHFLNKLLISSFIMNKIFSFSKLFFYL
jgi:hypothetical protein